MKLVRIKEFKAKAPWGSTELTRFGEIAVKAHWADKPYRWHRNTGREVFLVIDGVVDMHYRLDGTEKTLTLTAGDALTIEEGDEHVAHPRGEARILVIERFDSE